MSTVMMLSDPKSCHHHHHQLVLANRRRCSTGKIGVTTVLAESSTSIPSGLRLSHLRLSPDIMIVSSMGLSYIYTGTFKINYLLTTGW